MSESEITSSEIDGYLAEETGLNHLQTNIVRALCQTWLGNRSATLSAAEISTMIPAQPSKDAVRQAIARMRENSLPHPGTLLVRLSQTKYRVDVQRRSELELVPIRYRHRRSSGDVLRSFFLKSTDPLLIVAVDPIAFLNNTRRWFSDGSLLTKRVTLLTWKPESREVAATFARHLGENEDTAFERPVQAWRDWKDLERRCLREKRPILEVYYYRTPPTLLALANATHMQLELLPFHFPSLRRDDHDVGSATHRPALFLDAKHHPEGFQYFSETCRQIKLLAMMDTDEEDVEPEWRAERQAVLKGSYLSPRA